MQKAILAVLAFYCVHAALMCVAWLGFRLAHFPERVTVESTEGRRMKADVVGASKLRLGEWQRTKVRLYTESGEPSWDRGDGFAEMGVKRLEAIFLIRPPR